MAADAFMLIMVVIKLIANRPTAILVVGEGQPLLFLLFIEAMLRSILLTLIVIITALELFINLVQRYLFFVLTTFYLKAFNRSNLH